MVKRFPIALMALLALSLGSAAVACEACQDRDTFKASFVSAANSAAQAAAASSQPAAVQAAAPQPAAPRERTIADGPASPSGGFNQAPVRSPSTRIRSFNELR